MESFKQEGRGASKKLKRRGRRTRKKASEGRGAGGTRESTYEDGHRPDHFKELQIT